MQKINPYRKSQEISRLLIGILGRDDQLLG